MPPKGNKNALGHRCSEEARRRMGLAHLGKKATQETREKMRQSSKHGKPMLGRKMSLETRRKMSQSARKGPENHLWKGGITSVNQKIRTSLEYQLWRESVFERDNYACVWCGARCGDGSGKTVKLNADHIKPFSLYPELRFSLDNGRTLCLDCHKTTDTFAGKMKQLMSNHMTPKIEPLPGIIQLKFAEASAGVLDTSSKQSAVEYAEVVACGGGGISGTFKGEPLHIGFNVKPGDHVFVKSYGIDIITHDDTKYYFVAADSKALLAIVK